ncbi:MAG: ribonuclease J [Acidobacteriia bacterium]|nr:ribonuclease J [Terriglobia bacterium]
MSNQKVDIIPLGGLGEFGMNMMFVRCGSSAVVIDAGLMFPDDELLGVDVVIPDITFLKQHRDEIQAILLTHGHEDHIGALPFVLAEVDVPVYGTSFTLALVKHRLEEHGLLDSTRLVEVEPRQRVTLGELEVEFIQVTHSIVDAVALAITTPAGILVHTGDFKIDPTPIDHKCFDAERFEEYGRRGVLALFSDSTNVERSGNTPSERAVHARFDEIFSKAEGAIVVSCFATSLHRLQIVLDTAHKFHRQVAFLGRGMTQIYQLATEMGLLHFDLNLCVRPGYEKTLRRERMVYVATGSQGEPMAALARIAVDENKHFKIEHKDTVIISARMIPGNEKSVLRMVNHLYKRGAEVYYDDGSQPPIHVSGHASAEELKWMIQTTRPRFFIPVHGEYRQLMRHAQLAEETQAVSHQIIVMESGDHLVIEGDQAVLLDKVAVGRVCIDEGSLEEVDEVVMRERRHISEDGIVLPIIAINKHTGALERSPEIVSRGFLMMDQNEELMTNASGVVLKTIEGSSLEEKTDQTVIRNKITRDLKKFFFKQTQKRPMVLPVILEI